MADELAHFEASLSAEERAGLERLAAHDQQAWADHEAQAVARELAEDVFVLVTYMVAHGEVASLERLRERLGVASIDDALALCRQRAAMKERDPKP